MIKIIKQISFALLLLISFADKAMEKLEISDLGNLLALLPQGVVEIPLDFVFPRELHGKFTEDDLKAVQTDYKNAALSCHFLNNRLKVRTVIGFPKNINKRKFIKYVCDQTKKESQNVTLSEFLKYVPGYLKSKLKYTFYNQLLNHRSFLSPTWNASYLRQEHDRKEARKKGILLKYTKLGFVIENYAQFDECLQALQNISEDKIYNEKLKKLRIKFKGKMIDEVIDDLIKKSDVNAKDSYERIAAFYAATNPDCPPLILKLLLDGGTRKDQITDHPPKSALQVLQSVDDDLGKNVNVTVKRQKIMLLDPDAFGFDDPYTCSIQ